MEPYGYALIYKATSGRPLNFLNTVAEQVDIPIAYTITFQSRCKYKTKTAIKMIKHKEYHCL